MCGASNVRTSHRGCNAVISSRHFLRTNRSKRPCRQRIGHVTAQSRLRLSMRSTSQALALKTSRGSFASTRPSPSLRSRLPADPSSAASTTRAGTHLRSSIRASGTKSVGIGCRAKVEASTSPATRCCVAATSIAIGPENDSPRTTNRPSGALQNKCGQLIVGKRPVVRERDDLNRTE
jgi:hypothetical protein